MYGLLGFYFYGEIMFTKEQEDKLFQDLDTEIAEEILKLNTIFKDSIEQKMLEELKQINKNLEGVNTKLNTLINYSISSDLTSGEIN